MYFVVIEKKITLNKAHVTKTKKACTIAFMKARNSAVVHCIEKKVN